MSIIGIVGSRRRNTDLDAKLVREAFLEFYKEGDEIVSGGCRTGADSFAEKLAKLYQIPIKIYYAKWNKLGKQAGFARNTYIARDSDILIACVSKDRTGGTEDTIRKYLKFNKNQLFLV
jgi:hypothetical protein